MLKSLLKKLNACKEGVDYVADQSAIEAWNNCERGDWMLWIAQKQGVDLKVLTLAKVRCARLVEHLMTDDRSIAALEAAEKFANGEIDIDELNSAASASASAVADAADYADAAAAAAASADAAVADYADAADAAAAAASADAAVAAASAAVAVADAADYAAVAVANAADYADAAVANAADYADAAVANAADYADAAVYASDSDYAKKETLLKCAEICRETIPFNLLKIEDSQC